MTPRSPKQTPKTSTNSRRHRNRAGQNIAVKLPELPQVRSLRSRRAATSLSTRRPSTAYQSEPSEVQSQPVWDPSQDLDPFPPSNTSHPTGLEGPASPDLLLTESLQFAPYQSHPQSRPELASLTTEEGPVSYEPSVLQGSSLLPTSLPSLPEDNSAGDYGLDLPPEVEHQQNPSVDLQDMSTLGFMMPSQYAHLDHYGSSPLDSTNYSTMSHPQYADSSKSPAQQPHTSAPYPPAYASSLSLQNHEQTRRSGDYAVLPPYQPSSGPRSPYQPSLASMRVSPAPLNYPPSSSEPTPILSPPPHNYNYPAIQPSIPPLVSNNSSYPPQPIYPPTSYEMGYTPLPPTMYPPSTSSAPYSPYEQPASLPPPISAPIPPPSSERTAGNVMPRVLNSRPKPQCWEHGCNGRQFSTFSNLLRHQREKSGTAAKSYCKNCGAEFTRTTARNGHYVNGKCKPRRASDTSR